MTDLSARIAAARKAGYSDAEITAGLAKDATYGPRIATARGHGYSDGEIIGQLGRVNVGEDVAKSGAGGVLQGGAGVADAVIGFGPMGLLDSTLKTAANLGDALKGKVTTPAPPFNAMSRAAKAASHEPETPWGELAQTAGQMLPGALAPGSLPRRLANWLIPTLTTEGAGQAARAMGAGPKGEAAARIAGTLAGAGAASINPEMMIPRLKPLPAGSPGRVLADVGVSTTIPQRMGRAAKGVEDMGKRLPITGQAMAGYQDRQIEQLNRAIGLKALEPIGQGIPKDVKPGFDMVNFVDDRLSAVYDRAASMVPKVGLDEQLVSDAQAIAARRSDLAESEQKLWDSIVKDRLGRLESGEASGQTIKQITSELRGLQSEQARKGNVTLSGMIGDLRHALMGPVARADPEAADLIGQADEGWRIYSVMNDAAAVATNRGGVFLPGQLNAQVRSAAKGMGSNMAGKGKGPLQDIATAATQTIPDSYGNPGTANTAAAVGGGLELLHVLTGGGAPVPLAVATAGLTAAATPYFLAGRKVLESLPAKPTLQDLATADSQLGLLVEHDPEVGKLREMLLQRLGYVAAPATATVAAAQAP